ncbi:thermonuclease family protein [Aurantiacibacter spongiae]|uniref:Thermonuclease family protein n=1 Tax=Aurantiacibacter spongiae TaxID=2488860 RepID=A0A3N5CPD2_9SPHN|nr:thermonuclease family protein [Aurantiacibacter spongiae]RPF70427.1 thermonuclease family protein [Aurantiacibacter spongiae]
MTRHLPFLALAACTPAPPAMAQAEPLADCRITDGDTIRCGDERIRLLGIDAPELPGHCRQGRDCVEGDPYASTETLRRAMQGRLTIARAGTDRYGRTLAVVYADGVNLSCAQIEAGQAEYVERWDNGGMVARDCPGVR